MFQIVMTDYKRRVQKAVETYCKKNSPKLSPPRTNQKPELEFQKLLLNHLEKLNFSMDVVNSKAVYSHLAGRYLNSMSTVGMSDLVGCAPNGLAVYIECKAPGKRQNASTSQIDFLIRKINSNAFAIVCDSIEYFDDILLKFKSSDNRKALLLKELPQKGISS